MIAFRIAASLLVAASLLAAFAVPAYAADTLKPGGAVAPRATTRPPVSRDADAETYDHCMALAKSDPGAARDLAETWRSRGGAHPAEHCFAVALIGLQQYKQAATRLEALGQAMRDAPVSLRAEVLAQAAQAWLLAGDPAHAYAAGGAALTLRPDDPDLLVDQAEAAGLAGWFDKAIADLDRVLKAQPDRLDALIYRASAYRGQSQLDPALADIDRALQLAPNSVPGLLERGNIRGLKGDAAGARADWLRVSLLAPGTPADDAAKANIERLDLKPDKPATAPRR